MTLLIIYLALAIGVSFLCSILEAVLLSVSDGYIALLESEGRHRLAGSLRRLKQDIDQPLATILTLNTIAHTVGAAGVGAQSLLLFGDAYVALTSAILTFLILVFSEIIPKTIGARYWRQLAPGTARLLRFMIIGLYPFVVMSRWITGLFAGNKDSGGVSREELTAIAERGQKDGVLEKKEFIVLKNVMLLNSLRARDVMTPRVVVQTLDQNQSVATAFEQQDIMRFSRLPLYQGERENLVGYLLKADLLLHAARDHWDKPLSELKRELLTVLEVVDVKTLLDEMTLRQEHIAMLVDEYGGFAGIVTLEDIIETLLGLEIMDEVDDIEDMQQLARSKWRERAVRSKLLPEDELVVSSNADRVTSRSS
jgi:CBS domain containing-hemolysin-like protein